MRYDLGDFNAARDIALEVGDGNWPWMVIGVFPPEGTDAQDGWWNRFCYTTKAPMPAEMWAPCCSIEGRCMDFNLTGSILNRLTAGYIYGPLNDGDDVIVPLGIAEDPEHDDVDSVWWIGSPDTRERRQTFQSSKPVVIPVLWSSPLGFRYVTKSGRVLTDEDIQELADEAEAGYDITTLVERQQ